MSAAAPTFHGLIAANRRRSVLLLVAVFAILTITGVAIGALLSEPLAGGVVALGLASLLAAGSWFFGSSFVLRSLAAEPLPVEPQYDQLRNVVSEMSLAAGLPAPSLHLITNPGINAFSTGIDARHASIGVTSGLLETLDRQQLQGVIAHEMGHIRNMDTRFSLLLATLVGSIALATRILMRGALATSSGRGRKGGAVLFLLLAAAVAAIGWALSQLVALAASRQREYLADATAVDLTRNPRGIEEALIAMLDRGQLGNAVPSSTQHMFVVAPRHNWLESISELGATHPPLLDRVNILRALRQAEPLNESILAAQASQLAPLAPDYLGAGTTYAAGSRGSRQKTLRRGLALLIPAALAGILVFDFFAGSNAGSGLRLIEAEVISTAADSTGQEWAHLIYQDGNAFFEGRLPVSAPLPAGSMLYICVGPEQAATLPTPEGGC